MNRKKLEELFDNKIFVDSYAEDEHNTYRIKKMEFFPLIGELDVYVRITGKLTSASAVEKITYNFAVRNELSKPEIQRKKKGDD